MSRRTLIDVLEVAASTLPATGYRFVDRTGDQDLPFGDLLEQSRRTAAWLQRAGVGKGDRVLVILPTGADFARVFFGVVLCGAAPCVLPSPRQLGSKLDGHDQVRRIAERISALGLITTTAEIQGFEGSMPGLPCWAIDGSGDLLLADPAEFRPVQLEGDDLALVQASSGSTGVPKCVKLSHANILANLDQIGGALDFAKGEDVVVSWLPLYHDMGLIGCFLVVTYWRLRGVFLAPRRFLRRPIDWLRAISEHRGTVSPAPCFAYALVADRATDEEIGELDLSCFTKALCGSEQVDVPTLRRFANRFARSGFRPQSLVPCYGLAEATLAVTVTRLGEGLGRARISRRELALHGYAVPCTDPADGVTVADCGVPVRGAEVIVVDEHGRALPSGRVGRIRVKSPSVMAGYEGDPAATAAALRDGWLDTGDLGFLRRGRLFVTGRAKDVIVLRGQNYGAHDFEEAVAAALRNRQRRAVAFGVPEPDTGTEGLWILVETPRAPAHGLVAMLNAIRRHIVATTGVVPAHIGFVPRNWLPRTTSGKLQRSRARDSYLERITRPEVA